METETGLAPSASSGSVIVEVQPFDDIHRFLELSCDDRTTVIKLGMQLQDQGRRIQMSAQNSAWNAEITKLKQNHAHQLAVVTRESDELKTRIKALKTSFSAEKDALSSEITQNAHVTFKSQLDSLRQQNTTLETRLAKVVSDNRDATASQLKELREFYESKLQCQAKDFETIRGSYEERLTTVIGRNQNSNLKGKESEEELFTSLNQLFPTAVIEDTHTVPGRGDFVLRFDDIVMMVETKNYTRNVQKSEVDKFYRDMESQANSDVQCGILLSMNCGICAYDDFALEVRSGKPMMFLHNVRNNLTHIRLATHMFNLILSQKSLDLSNKELRGRLAQLAKNVKTNYQKQKTHLDKYYQQSLGFIEDQQTNIRELFGALTVKY